MGDFRIGKKFNTVEGGTLTVLSTEINVSSKGRKVVSVYCNCDVCSKDTELFKKPFKTLYDSLMRGNTPCGCKRGYPWNQEQQEVRVQRALEGEPYNFLGFYDGYRDSHSVATCYCEFCKEDWSSGVYHILNGVRCCGCKGRRIAEKILSKGIPSVGDSFIGMSGQTLTVEGREGKWVELSCNNCQGGDPLFWNSNFKVQYSDIKRKGVCGCDSNKFKYSEHQNTLRVVRRLEERNSLWRFIGYDGGYKRSKSILNLDCTLHGLWKTPIQGLLFNNPSCPYCLDLSQLYTYINIILCPDYGTPLAIKYGKTNDVERRRKEQDRKTANTVNTLMYWEFEREDLCKDAERTVNSLFRDDFKLSSRDLPDGFSETTSISNIEAVIEIFEEYGGVRTLV